MYSADGYCIDQGASRAIRYGKCSSAQNGCGWIAAYNLLRIAGKPYPPARVRAGLAPTLWMGGRMGTRVTALWRYLHRRGVTLIPTLRSSKAAEGPGGLAFYYTGKGFHFVASASAGRPRRYRFLNAVYGRDRLLCTPQQFRKQFFKHGVGLFFRIAEPCQPMPWTLSGFGKNKRPSLFYNQIFKKSGVFYVASLRNWFFRVCSTHLHSSQNRH